MSFTFTEASDPQSVLNFTASESESYPLVPMRLRHTMQACEEAPVYRCLLLSSTSVVGLVCRAVVFQLFARRGF